MSDSNTHSCFHAFILSCCDRVDVEVVVLYFRASDLQEELRRRPVVRFLKFGEGDGKGRILCPLWPGVQQLVRHTLNGSHFASSRRPSLLAAHQPEELQVSGNLGEEFVLEGSDGNTRFLDLELRDERESPFDMQ